ARARLERVEQLPLLWNRREHEDLGPDGEGDDPARGLQPSFARHGQIHEDDVRPSRLRALNGFVAGSGPADHDEIALLLAQPAQPCPLRAADVRRPEPGPGQVLIAVKACGVCRTDLHIFDAELPNPKLPLVLGHEIVGTVVATGPGLARFAPGERVGVPWLGWSCGECRYCRAARENLCDRARFTGYQIDG